MDKSPSSFAISSLVTDNPELQDKHFKFGIAANTSAFTLLLKNEQTSNQAELKSSNDAATHSSPLEISKFPGVSQLMLTVNSASLTMPLLLDVEKELNKKDILFTVTPLPELLTAELPPSVALSRNDSDKTRSIITGLNFEITQDMLGKDKVVEIYGDTITINSPLHLFGKDIVIHARNFISLGGSINVSGDKPQSDFAPGARAQDGAPVSTPGENGNNGSPSPGIGSNGENGGNVLLVAENAYGDFLVTSNGGSGGRGQDGGNGSDGMPGGDGDKDVLGQNWSGYKNVDKPGTKGHDGGRGGDGGPAGASGSGGDGGIFTSAVIHKFGNLFFRSAAGTAAEKAKPGEPGKGKDGGNGGQRVQILGGKEHWSWVSDDPNVNGKLQYYEHGRHGADGNKIENNSVVKAGKAGNYVEKKDAKYPDFIATYPANLFQHNISLRVAELLYMNEAYAEAATMLVWLVQVTPKVGDSVQPPNNASEWLQINRRATALLDQLSQKLSFYGQPRNHVPILELSSYQTELDAFILMGNIIEARNEIYNNTKKSNEEKIAALKETIAQQDKVIAQIESARNQLRNSQIPDIQNEIAQISIVVADKFTDLNNASTSFKNAVERKAQCRFDELIGFVSAAVTLGLGAFQLVSGIAKTLSAFNEFTKEAKEFSDVTKELKIVGKGLTNAKNAWPDIKKSIPDAAPDLTKIAFQKEDFDDLIAPFLEMDEALQYKKHVHGYLNAVQTRNGKVIKYSSMATETERLSAEIDQKKAEITRLKTSIATTFDPTITEFASFMETAYAGIKNIILKYLFEENEAYIFWALQDRPFKSGSQTIAQLAVTHTNLKRDIIENKQHVLGLKERFSGTVITITTTSHPSEFENFKKIRTTPKGNKVYDLTFSILPDDKNFGNHRWQILANSFAISMPGVVTANKKLDARLVHNGEIQITNQNGENMIFSHDSILSNYEYDFSSGEEKFKSGGSLGGDELNKDIIGLSPFATWTVRIVADDNPGLNLDAVDKIILTFSGVNRLLPTLLA